MKCTLPAMSLAVTAFFSKPRPWRMGVATLIAAAVLGIALAACSGPAATSPQQTGGGQPTESTPTSGPQPVATRSRERALRYEEATPPPVEAEINGCKIEPDTQCPGADLAGADLGTITAGSHHVARFAAQLTRGNFRGATFEGAYLAGTRLSGADLSNANLRGADLYGAELFEADLTGADLTDADLSFADIEDAKLDGAIFCRTTMPDTSINNSGCP